MSSRKWEISILLTLKDLFTLNQPLFISIHSQNSPDATQTVISVSHS